MSVREVFIEILYDRRVESKQLEEICAGLEEEGVPFHLQLCEETLGLAELGAKAASMSPLLVGIGVDGYGDLCLHHEKLAEQDPYLKDSERNRRRLGKNAARLIKGLPLDLSQEGMDRYE